MAICWIVLQELRDNIYDLFPVDFAMSFNFRAGVRDLHGIEIPGYQTVTQALIEPLLLVIGAAFQEFVAVIEPRNRWGCE